MGCIVKSLVKDPVQNFMGKNLAMLRVGVAKG